MNPKEVVLELEEKLKLAELKIQVLAEFYEEHEDCKDNGYDCDYRTKGCESLEQCPCAVARQALERIK